MSECIHPSSTDVFFFILGEGTASNCQDTMKWTSNKKSVADELSVAFTRDASAALCSGGFLSIIKSTETLFRFFNIHIESCHTCKLSGKRSTKDLSWLTSIRNIFLTIFYFTFAHASYGEMNDSVKNFIVTSEVNRFFSLNHVSEVDRDLLTSELIKYLTLHESQLGGFPDHALDTLGDKEISALLKSFFSTTAENLHVLDAHIKNYSSDLDSEVHFFKSLIPRLGVFILTQYIPLTYSQRHAILADPDKYFPQVKPGKFLRYTFELSTQHISSLLPQFLNEPVKQQFNVHQQELVHFLGDRVFRSAFDLFLPIEGDSGISHTLFLWRPLDLYIDNNTSSRSSIYIDILDKYFHTLSQSWVDEYNLPVSDSNKLVSAARISVQQYLNNYPTIADLVNANSKLRRHHWMFLSITHEIIAQPTWQKMVGKISATQSQNPPTQQLQPLSDLLDYYKLCSQLNIAVWLIASRCGSFDGLFSGYQSGVTESNFISGDLLNILYSEMCPIGEAVDHPIDYPDLSYIDSLQKSCEPVLEKHLSDSQRTALSDLVLKFE